MTKRRGIVMLAISRLFCFQASYSHYGIGRRYARNGQKLTQVGQRASQPRKRPGKKELREALVAAGGVVTAVAAGYGVTRQSLYTWINFYDLRPAIEEARRAMFDIAVDNILEAVEAKDLDMSKFVVTHMPLAGRWSNRQELTGANGAPLNATPELLSLMARLGISGDDLVQELETMLRKEAAAAGALPEPATKKKTTAP